MSIESEWLKHLQDADMKYLDSLLEKAQARHDNSFSFSYQHFENYDDAQQTMSRWQGQHPDVSRFTINLVDVTVFLQNKS